MNHIFDMEKMTDEKEKSALSFSSITAMGWARLVEKFYRPKRLTSIRVLTTVHFQVDYPTTKKILTKVLVSYYKGLECWLLQRVLEVSMGLRWSSNPTTKCQFVSQTFIRHQHLSETACGA